MTICDVLKLLEFFTDMQFLEFSFEVFFLKLIFLHSKFPDINVLAFQISDFEYTQQITAQNTWNCRWNRNA